MRALIQSKSTCQGVVGGAAEGGQGGKYEARLVMPKNMQIVASCHTTWQH